MTTATRATPNAGNRAPSGLQLAVAGAAWLLMAMLAGAPQPARATITLTANDALRGGFFNLDYVRRLTLRVGADSSAISNVTFNVTGANVSPSPTAVTGVPNAGATASGAPANSVRISVSNRWTDFAGQRVVVTADASAGLACSAGPCGATVIPFNKISWVSSGLATGPYAGQDFGSGSFSGSNNQTLINFTAPAARSFNITNDWVFSYANDTLYPAGVYTGRVTFTATMP